MTQDYVQALHSFQAMLIISPRTQQSGGSCLYALEGVAFVAFYIQRDNISIQLWATVDSIRRRADLCRATLLSGAQRKCPCHATVTYWSIMLSVCLVRWAVAGNRGSHDDSDEHIA